MSPLILDPGQRTQTHPKRSNPLSFAVFTAQREDVRRLVDIEFFAFENERTNHILSFRDHKKPAHFERAVKMYSTAMARIESSRYRIKTALNRHSGHFSGANYGGNCFRKVMDTESGLIISWAKTEIKTYTPAELASPLDQGHEQEPKMNRDWFALNEQMRRAYVGIASHCYIAMLATQTSYQHRGAGTMLLEDILAEADDARIECYLEATDTAKPLYERHGFHTVNELKFNPVEYGVRGYAIERQTVMVRGALSEDGLCRKPVRSWDMAVEETRAQLQAIEL